MAIGHGLAREKSRRAVIHSMKSKSCREHGWRVGTRLYTWAAAVLLERSNLFRWQFRMRTLISIDS